MEPNLFFLERHIDENRTQPEHVARETVGRLTGSFADAKISENLVQYFFGINMSGDFADLLGRRSELK